MAIKYTRFASCLIMAFLSSAHARPDDPCLPILAGGLFDEYQLSGQSQFDGAFRQWLMLDEASRHDFRKASAAGAKGGYGKVFGEFSKSFSVSESNDWRKSVDTGTFETRLEQSRTSVYMKTLGPNAVALADRFNDCRRLTLRGGGRISLEEQENGYVMVRIGFDPVPGGVGSATLVNIRSSHQPQNGSFDSTIAEKPDLGLSGSGAVAERAFVVKRGECDPFWIVATFQGFGDTVRAVPAPAVVRHQDAMQQWKREKDRIESLNREAERNDDVAMQKWRLNQEEEDRRYARAVAAYEREVRERRLVAAKRTKGGRGSNSDSANRPYNFRLDVPRGSLLYFEVEPNATVRMRRDRPNGGDPMIFDNIRNGSTFRTTWDPGCENCDFYFKQDDVERASIVVWLNGKPERPQKKNIPKPVPSKALPLPPKPKQPSC